MKETKLKNLNIVKKMLHESQENYRKNGLVDFADAILKRQKVIEKQIELLNQ